MITLSQNKKIAVAAVFIFLVSFSSLLFFLQQSGGVVENGQADVSHAGDTKESEANDEPAPLYAEEFDKLTEPSLVTNVEGIIQSVNEAFCDLINIECEKLLQKSFFDLLNSKDVSELAAIHSKAVNSGEELTGLGPYRILKDKKELLLLFKTKPVSDGKDKVQYVIFSAKDITEQAEGLNKEKTSEETQKDLEESGEGTDAGNDIEEWIKNLYPNFEELKKEIDGRFMAEINK